MLNSTKKASHAIGQKSAQSLYYAFDQAQRLNMPLNTHVTINFANTKCEPQKALLAFAKLRLSHFKRWAARRGFPATGGYAFENSRDDKAILTVDENHNIHVHWALHVPPRLRNEFEAVLYGWVELVTGGILEAGNVIKITNPPPLILRQYVLKGTTEMWAKIYGATAKPQGLIVGGRRAGTTLNVGPKARKATDKELGIKRKIPAKPQAKVNESVNQRAQG